MRCKNNIDTVLDSALTVTHNERRNRETSMKTTTVRKYLAAARKAHSKMVDCKIASSHDNIRTLWSLAVKADDAACSAIWAGECQTTMDAIMAECSEIKRWCDAELEWKAERYQMNLPKPKKKTWLDQVAC